MAGLRDQLLKSGLVNEKQVKKAEKEKRKGQQNQPQGKAGEVSDEQMRRQQAQIEKQERDRLLNQQLKEAADKRALAAQARQLIETHKLPYQEGDTPFNFTDTGKVKKLYLESKVRDQLVRGLLGIVKFDSQYALVPRETAEKIRQRDPSALLLLNDPPGQPQPEADDPYAQYQIPDDLIW